MANFLSWILIGEALIGVVDDLPDDNIFQIRVEVDWYDELLPFMETGMFHGNLSKDQHNNLALRSCTLMIIVGQLCKMSID